MLREYLSGVVDRAEHHARNVDEIVLALVGAIVSRKDDEPLEVMSSDGAMKNVLWVRISGTRYAFSFNQVAGSVELRRGSTRGEAIASFTNETTVRKVKELFAGL